MAIIISACTMTGCMMCAMMLARTYLGHQQRGIDARGEGSALGCKAAARSEATAAAATTPAREVDAVAHIQRGNVGWEGAGRDGGGGGWDGRPRTAVRSPSWMSSQLAERILFVTGVGQRLVSRPKRSGSKRFLAHAGWPRLNLVGKTGR